MGNRNLIIGVVVVVVLVIGAFFLFGGNNGLNGPAPAATTIATDTPAAPATDTPAALTPAVTPEEEGGTGGAQVDAPAIQNITWVWESRTTPSDGSSEAIPSPANYTLFFNPDGTYQFQADCNNGSGTYTADQSGAIRMTAGPMTLAECGEASRSQDMLGMMQAVQDHRVEDGSTLIMVWPAGGPEDVYRAQ